MGVVAPTPPTARQPGRLYRTVASSGRARLWRLRDTEREMS
jgi:hypothetical protein